MVLYCELLWRTERSWGFVWRPWRQWEKLNVGEHKARNVCAAHLIVMIIHVFRFRNWFLHRNQSSTSILISIEIPRDWLIFYLHSHPLHSTHFWDSSDFKTQLLEDYVIGFSHPGRLTLVNYAIGHSTCCNTSVNASSHLNGKSECCKLLMKMSSGGELANGNVHLAVVVSDTRSLVSRRPKRVPVSCILVLRGDEPVRHTASRLYTRETRRLGSLSC